MSYPWDIVPFGELYLEPSRNGLTRPTAVRGSGFKMVNMGELYAYPRLNDPEMDRVPMSEAERVRFALKPGDLLFARQSLVLEGAGKCSIVLNCEKDTTFESHLIRVRLDSSKADPSFFYYFFRSGTGSGTMQTIVNQVAAAGIRGSDLAKLKVIRPPLPIQRKIATILMAYDELIDNNKRYIALLEKMAEELYREWFVRMRFPGHQDAQVDKGVPVGWALRKFADLVHMNPKESVHKDDYAPHVAMDDLSVFSMHFTSKVDRKGAAGSKFRNRDTLLPRITPCLENGKRGFVTCLKDNEIGIGSTEFIVFREKILPAEYIYLLSCNPSFRQHAELSMTGASGRQRVQHDCFSYFYLPEPPESIRNQFVEIIRPLFESIELKSRENVALTQTRDLLLPRLISGKLSVEELDIQFPPSMQEALAEFEAAHA